MNHPCRRWERNEVCKTSPRRIGASKSKSKMKSVRHRRRRNKKVTKNSFASKYPNFFLGDNEVLVARDRLKGALRELLQHSDEGSSAEDSEEREAQEYKLQMKKMWVVVLSRWPFLTGPTVGCRIIFIILIIYIIYLQGRDVQEQTDKLSKSQDKTQKATADGSSVSSHLCYEAVRQKRRSCSVQRRHTTISYLQGVDGKSAAKSQSGSKVSYNCIVRHWFAVYSCCYWLPSLQRNLQNLQKYQSFKWLDVMLITIIIIITQQ